MMATQRLSPQYRSRRYMGHTVRIILTQDVSDGKLYSGDIATVKAGYARNFLIPQKKAVYATRQNFVKLNMKDPELETAEERQARLDREAIAGDDKDLKAADVLRTYLSNKVVCLTCLFPCSMRYSLSLNVFDDGCQLS